MSTWDVGSVMTLHFLIIGPDWRSTQHRCCALLALTAFMGLMFNTGSRRHLMISALPCVFLLPGPALNLLISALTFALDMTSVSSSLSDPTTTFILT